MGLNPRAAVAASFRELEIIITGGGMPETIRHVGVASGRDQFPEPPGRDVFPIVAGTRPRLSGRRMPRYLLRFWSTSLCHERPGGGHPHLARPAQGHDVSGSCLATWATALPFSHHIEVKPTASAHRAETAAQSNRTALAQVQQ
jgi:hypothetical protein